MNIQTIVSPISKTAELYCGVYCLPFVPGTVTDHIPHLSPPCVIWEIKHCLYVVSYKTTSELQQTKNTGITFAAPQNILICFSCSISTSLYRLLISPYYFWRNQAKQWAIPSTEWKIKLTVPKINSSPVQQHLHTHKRIKVYNYYLYF